MKVKKIIISLFVILLTIIASIGQNFVLASSTLGAKLSYIRYDESMQSTGNAYAINNNSAHPVYQILSVDSTGHAIGKNLYCLSAEKTYSWGYSTYTDPSTGITHDFNGNLDSIANYSSSYNYDEITDTSIIDDNFPYYTEIQWILDNCYVPTGSNESDKIALLENVGIVKTTVFFYDATQGNYYTREVFTYLPGDLKTRYQNALEDISNHLDIAQIPDTDRYYADAGCYVDIAMEQNGVNTYITETGDFPKWIENGSGYGNVASVTSKEAFAYEETNTMVDAILPDELMEVIQQAAIWYFTEYDEDPDVFRKYNCYTESSATTLNSWLRYTTDTSEGPYNWPLLTEYTVPVGSNNIEVGKMYQSQAILLYNYLVDGAKKAKQDGYASGNAGTIDLKYINNSNRFSESGSNYIVGPMKIETTGTVSELAIEVKTGNDLNTNITSFEIQDGSGNATSLAADKEFYVSIPKSSVNVNLKIVAKGKTDGTSKTLWVNNTVGEQQLVDISKEPIPISDELPVERVFDLALRKAIVKVTDATGTKNIINENGVAANRVIDYDTSSLSSGTTATYKHRKDPVMVKKGDKVTYRITVYNEGDQAGYPTKIVDQLPSGLVVPGGVTSGTYKNGNVEYTYTYDSASRKITFTNVSNNVLDPYNGGTSLDSESIEIELEVTEDAGTNGKYKYLTNIAYISEEYNSEEDKTITTTRGEDRDSEPGTYPTSTLNTEAVKNGYNGYKGSTSNSVYNHNDGKFYYAGQQDDDDFEIIAIKPEQFDLKLVKFISKINEQTARTVTSIDSSDLKTNTWEKKTNGYGEECSADYTLSKDPLKVKTGDYVTYTLRVYNEGDISGYAEEITENIPTGLEFVYDDKITIGADGKVDYTNCTKTLSDEDKKAIEFNLSQGWSIKTTDSSTGRITETKSDLLSRDKSTSNLIKAFDYAHDDGKGSGLSYKDIQIKLKVIATDPKIGVIRNEAAITDDADENGNDIIDRDSEPENWPGKNDHTKYQDDEDYDNVILAEFDLALRKFIAAVSKDINIENGEYLTVDGTSKTEYTRAPVVDTSKLKSGEATTAIYKHPKDAVTVAREDYVLYTIRVYNEGDVDGYAAEITDHLPTYLDYVECEFNDKYGWKVASDGKTVSTTCLSSEKSKDNILKAFDSSHDDGKGSGLSYKDVQILCKVNKNAIPMKNITNIAEIDEYQDEDGNEVPSDRDSDSDSLTDEILDQDKRPEYEGGKDTDKNDGYVPGQEDDDDFERIIVREFDLALLKYVSEVHVIENGKETVTQTGNTGNNATDVIPKVEIYRKSLNSTVVKFVYTIKITNEGDIPGYATEITDYVPAGLKFYEEDNSDWVDEGNNVISTRALKGTLLNPGESATVTVTFRWINGGDNLGTKTNYAEISEDYNEYGIQDRDSTPDNKIIEEDDMDYAQVILSISTGLKENITLYVTLSGISLAVLASGIVLIKKFVL